MNEQLNKKRANKILNKVNNCIKTTPVIGWIHSRFSDDFDKWFPLFQTLSIVGLTLYFLIKIFIG